MSKKVLVAPGRKVSRSKFVAMCLNDMRGKPEYQDRWMTATTWLQLVLQEYVMDPIFCDKGSPTVKDLAIGLNNLFKADGTNLTEWRANSQKFYKASNHGRTAYISTSKSGLPKIKPGSIDWDAIGKFDIDKIRKTRSRKRALVTDGSLSRSGTRKPFRSAVGANSTPRLTRSKASSMSLAASMVTPTTTRKKETSSSNVSSSNTEFSTSVNCAAMEVDNNKELGHSMHYWNSGKAIGLFGIAKPENEEVNLDVRAVVKKRIVKLDKMWRTSGGWKLGVEDLDSLDLYSEHDIFTLRWNCRYNQQMPVLAG